MTVNLELMREWGARVQRVLYPPVCLLCRGVGQPGMDLCGACQADLPANRICCPRCAQPLTGARALCGGCIRRAPAFDASFVPLLYRAPVDGFVHGLKFQGRLVYGRLLAEILVRNLGEVGRDFPDCLIPVPLHPRRLRERGFNQSLIIARHLGGRLGVPVVVDAVARVRWTPPQVGLAADPRRANPRGAFVAAHVPAAARIAVVDDVMTTGATAHEVARVLRAAGAGFIEVWCAARAE